MFSNLSLTILNRLVMNSVVTNNNLLMLFSWCYYHGHFFLPPFYQNSLANSLNRFENADYYQRHQQSVATDDLHTRWTAERDLYVYNIARSERNRYSVPYIWADYFPRGRMAKALFAEKHNMLEHYQYFASVYVYVPDEADWTEVFSKWADRRVLGYGRFLFWTAGYLYFLWRRFIVPAAKLLWGLFDLTVTILWALCPLYWCGAGLYWIFLNSSYSATNYTLVYGIAWHVIWPAVWLGRLALYCVSGWQPHSCVVHSRSNALGISNWSVVQLIEHTILPIRYWLMNASWFSKLNGSNVLTQLNNVIATSGLDPNHKHVVRLINLSNEFGGSPRELPMKIVGMFAYYFAWKCNRVSLALAKILYSAQWRFFTVINGLNSLIVVVLRGPKNDLPQRVGRSCLAGTVRLLDRAGASDRRLQESLTLVLSLASFLAFLNALRAFVVYCCLCWVAYVVIGSLLLLLLPVLFTIGSVEIFMLLPILTPIIALWSRRAFFNKVWCGLQTCVFSFGSIARSTLLPSVSDDKCLPIFSRVHFDIVFLVCAGFNRSAQFVASHTNQVISRLVSLITSVVSFIFQLVRCCIPNRARFDIVIRVLNGFNHIVRSNASRTNPAIIRIGPLIISVVSFIFQLVSCCLSNRSSLSRRIKAGIWSGVCMFALVVHASNAILLAIYINLYNLITGVLSVGRLFSQGFVIARRGNSYLRDVWSSYGGVLLGGWPYSAAQAVVSLLTLICNTFLHSVRTLALHFPIFVGINVREVVYLQLVPALSAAVEYTRVHAIYTILAFVGNASRGLGHIVARFIWAPIFKGLRGIWCLLAYAGKGTLWFLCFPFTLTAWIASSACSLVGGLRRVARTIFYFVLFLAKDVLLSPLQFFWPYRVAVSAFSVTFLVALWISNILQADWGVVSYVIYQLALLVLYGFLAWVIILNALTVILLSAGIVYAYLSIISGLCRFVSWLVMSIITSVVNAWRLVVISPLAWVWSRAVNALRVCVDSGVVRSLLLLVVGCGAAMLLPGIWSWMTIQAGLAAYTGISVGVVACFFSLSIGLQGLSITLFTLTLVRTLWVVLSLLYTAWQYAWARIQRVALGLLTACCYSILAASRDALVSVLSVARPLLAGLFVTTTNGLSALGRLLRLYFSVYALEMALWANRRYVYLYLWQNQLYFKGVYISTQVWAFTLEAVNAPLQIHVRGWLPIVEVMWYNAFAVLACRLRFWVGLSVFRNRTRIAQTNAILLNIFNVVVNIVWRGHAVGYVITDQALVWLAVAGDRAGVWLDLFSAAYGRSSGFFTVCWNNYRVAAGRIAISLSFMQNLGLFSLINQVSDANAAWVTFWVTYCGPIPVLWFICSVPSRVIKLVSAALPIYGYTLRLHIELLLQLVTYIARLQKPLLRAVSSFYYDKEPLGTSKRANGVRNCKPAALLINNHCLVIGGAFMYVIGRISYIPVSVVGYVGIYMYWVVMAVLQSGVRFLALSVWAAGQVLWGCWFLYSRIVRPLWGLNCREDFFTLIGVEVVVEGVSSLLASEPLDSIFSYLRVWFLESESATPWSLPEAPQGTVSLINWICVGSASPVLAPSWRWRYTPRETPEPSIWYLCLISNKRALIQSAISLLLNTGNAWDFNYLLAQTRWVASCYQLRLAQANMVLGLARLGRRIKAVSVLEVYGFASVLTLRIFSKLQKYNPDWSTYMAVTLNGTPGGAGIYEAWLKGWRLPVVDAIPDSPTSDSVTDPSPQGFTSSIITLSWAIFAVFLLLVVRQLCSIFVNYSPALLVPLCFCLGYLVGACSLAYGVWLSIESLASLLRFPSLVCCELLQAIGIVLVQMRLIPRGLLPYTGFNTGPCNTPHKALADYILSFSYIPHWWVAGLDRTSDFAVAVLVENWLGLLLWNLVALYRGQSQARLISARLSSSILESKPTFPEVVVQSISSFNQIKLRYTTCALNNVLPSRLTNLVEESITTYWSGLDEVPPGIRPPRIMKGFWYKDISVQTQLFFVPTALWRFTVGCLVFISDFPIQYFWPAFIESLFWGLYGLRYHCRSLYFLIFSMIWFFFNIFRRISFMHNPWGSYWPMAQIVNTSDYRLARRFYLKHGVWTELEWSLPETRSSWYFRLLYNNFCTVFFPLNFLIKYTLMLSELLLWIGSPLINYIQNFVERWINPGFFAVSSFVVWGQLSPFKASWLFWRNFTALVSEYKLSALIFIPGLLFYAVCALAYAVLRWVFRWLASILYLVVYGVGLTCVLSITNVIALGEAMLVMPWRLVFNPIVQSICASLPVPQTSPAGVLSFLTSNLILELPHLCSVEFSTSLRRGLLAALLSGIGPVLLLACSILAHNSSQPVLGPSYKSVNQRVLIAMRRVSNDALTHGLTNYDQSFDCYNTPAMWLPGALFFSLTSANLKALAKASSLGLIVVDVGFTTAVLLAPVDIRLSPSCSDFFLQWQCNTFELVETWRERVTSSLHNGFYKLSLVSRVCIFDCNFYSATIWLRLYAVLPALPSEGSSPFYSEWQSQDHIIECAPAPKPTVVCKLWHSPLPRATPVYSQPGVSWPSIQQQYSWLYGVVSSSLVATISYITPQAFAEWDYNIKVNVVACLSSLNLSSVSLVHHIHHNLVCWGWCAYNAHRAFFLNPRLWSHVETLAECAHSAVAHLISWGWRIAGPTFLAIVSAVVWLQPIWQLGVLSRRVYRASNDLPWYFLAMAQPILNLVVWLINSIVQRVVWGFHWGWNSILPKLELEMALNLAVIYWLGQEKFVKPAVDVKVNYPTYLSARIVSRVLSAGTYLPCIYHYHQLFFRKCHLEAQTRLNLRKGQVIAELQRLFVRGPLHAVNFFRRGGSADLDYGSNLTQQNAYRGFVSWAPNGIWQAFNFFSLTSWHGTLASTLTTEWLFKSLVNRLIQLLSDSPIANATWYFLDGVLGYTWLVFFRPQLLIFGSVALHIGYHLLEHSSLRPYYLIFAPFHAYFVAPLNVITLMYSQRGTRPVWPALLAGVLGLWGLNNFYWLVSLFHVKYYKLAILAKVSGVCWLNSSLIIDWCFAVTLVAYGIGIWTIEEPIFDNWKRSFWNVVVAVPILLWVLEFHPYTYADHDMAAFGLFMGELLWFNIWYHWRLGHGYTFLFCVWIMWLWPFVPLQFSFLFPWFVAHWEPDVKRYYRKLKLRYADWVRPTYTYGFSFFFAYYNLVFYGDFWYEQLDPISAMLRFIEYYGLQIDLPYFDHNLMTESWEEEWGVHLEFDEYLSEMPTACFYNFDKSFWDIPVGVQDRVNPSWTEQEPSNLFDHGSYTTSLFWMMLDDGAREDAWHESLLFHQDHYNYTSASNRWFFLSWWWAWYQYPYESMTRFIGHDLLSGLPFLETSRMEVELFPPLSENCYTLHEWDDTSPIEMGGASSESAATWWDIASGGWESEAIEANAIAYDHALFMSDATPWNPLTEGYNNVLHIAPDSGSRNTYLWGYQNTFRYMTAPYRNRYWMFWRWGDFTRLDWDWENMGWNTLDYIRRWFVFIDLVYWSIEIGGPEFNRHSIIAYYELKADISRWWFRNILDAPTYALWERFGWV